MKKFMKIVAVAAMLLAATNAFAQLEVGFGFASQMYKGTSTERNAQKYYGGYNAYGFYVGAAYGIELFSNFKVQPGVYYSMTSANKVYEVYDGDRKEETIADEDFGPMVFHDVNVPILFSYSFPLGPVKITPFLGPNFLIGIEASQAVKDSDWKKIYGNSYSLYKDYDLDLETGKIKTSPSDITHFDVQGQVGVAVDINNLFIVKGGFNFGFLDRNKADKNIVHTNSWFIGVAVSL